MFTLAVFIISLVLLVVLFVVKNQEIYRGKKVFLENLFSKCDAWILKVLPKIKYGWSHVNLKNVILIFSWAVVNIKELSTSVKKRFDHKQSHFFTKNDYDSPKNKSSVSFFLKDVSDYKKNLREENRNKESES